MTRQAAVLVLALVVCGCDTSAPPTPALPSGPVWATVGDSCEYSTWTQIAGGRAVAYRFDWGDGDTSDWSEFVPGGTQVLGEHVWNSGGLWPVRSQAQGPYGARSEWSAALDVNVRPMPGYHETPVATIEVGGYTADITVSPDGSRIFVANCGNTGNTDLLAIRTSDNSVTGRIPGMGGRSLAISASGDSLYLVDGESLYLITTQDFTVCCSTGISIEVPDVVLPAGSGQVWVCYSHWAWGGRIAVLRDSDLTEVAEVNLDWTMPMGMAASPDGKLVYVALSDDNAVAVVSTADFNVVRRIPVGATPVDVALSPNGRLAFTADYMSYSVTVIRTADNTVLGSLLVCYEPMDLEFDPGGRYLYVACEDEYGAVVDVDRLEVLPATWKDARCVTCLPDGSRLYTGGRGQVVTVFGFRNQD